MKSDFNIVGLGEILWDVYPDYKKLGGAPANFSYFVAKLGQKGIPVSRIGDDALGDQVIKELDQKELEQSHIQVDRTRPTGTVDVLLDDKGKPSFVINKDVAWDHIELNDDLLRLSSCIDGVCFGSLAQRSKVSRRTIRGFLRAMPKDSLRIFDINIRQDYYSKQIITESLEMATVLKINSDELVLLKKMLGPGSLEEDLQFCTSLLKKFCLDLVCLTKGEDGSILIDRNSHSIHGGIEVDVIDTVGAGDAFTAAMAVYYLGGSDLEEINERANRIAAWTASKKGAMPEPDKYFKKILGA